MDAGAAKLIGAGISVIALFGVGMGLGNLFSSLIQSIALLAFVVAMIILFTA